MERKLVGGCITGGGLKERCHVHKTSAKGQHGNEPARTDPEQEFTLYAPGTFSAQGEWGEPEYKVFFLLIYHLNISHLMAPSHSQRDKCLNTLVKPHNNSRDLLPWAE